MPVTVLGLTLARSVSRWLEFMLWSIRKEYKLVPSKTGKFPICEASVWYEAGTGAHAVPGEQLVGKPAQLVSNPPVAPATSWLGQTPFTACPDDAPVSTAYCSTAPRKSGFASAASVTGFVKKETWAGVSCKVPKGSPTAVVSKGVRPKLSCPMLENPVSWRRVTS